MSEPKILTVACPTCKGPSLFAPSNRWRPFCSERCRQIDLGAWASESFRVEATPPTEGPEDLVDDQVPPPEGVKAPGKPGSPSDADETQLN